MNEQRKPGMIDPKERITWNDVAKITVVMTVGLAMFVGVVWATVWGVTQIIQLA